jgi:hypothetical protein
MEASRAISRAILFWAIVLREPLVVHDTCLEMPCGRLGDPKIFNVKVLPASALHGQTAPCLLLYFSYWQNTSSKPLHC